MTFGDIFSEINLDSWIIDAILLTKLTFLASKLIFPARDIKEMTKIVTKQNSLSFDRRKTLRKSTITFNYRIIDGHVDVPFCMLLFDKSNKKSIKLDTAVMWSKSNLNMMNIYGEKYHQFLNVVAPQNLWIVCLSGLLTDEDYYWNPWCALN